MKKKTLVVVESPTKAKTIEKYLGNKKYTVMASMGHLRDLPKSQFGIDVENDFAPKYINIRGKGDLIKSLKKEAKKSEKYEVKEINKDVAVIKCVADMDSTLIDFVVEKGFGGIVIEALGRGNVPPRMVEGIKKALDKEIPVVVVSRCFEGRVHESYGYEGGGKMLKDLGVIFGDTLPGQKARIKLALAINSNIKKEEIEKQF